jgi:hypothetical protein
MVSTSTGSQLSRLPRKCCRKQRRPAVVARAEAPVRGDQPRDPVEVRDVGAAPLEEVPSMYPLGDPTDLPQIAIHPAIEPDRRHRATEFGDPAAVTALGEGVRGIRRPMIGYPQPAHRRA